MVVDTSALLAILRDEPQRRRLTEALEEAGHVVRRRGASRCCSRGAISPRPI